jgi:alpha-galactosidase
MKDRREVPNKPGNAGDSVSRRSFLLTGASALGSLAAIPAVGEEQGRRGVPQRSDSSPKAATFIDLLRVPDRITAYSSFEKTLPAGRSSLKRSGERWSGEQIVVESNMGHHGLVLTLTSPSAPVAAIHVRWQARVTPELLTLGDAWERSYGNLGWRNLIPQRAMPWYFATYDGAICNGYGVKTDTRALCFWQLDSEGVSLWLNVTNGGNGVELGDRTLEMATVVSHRGHKGESAMEAITALCGAMCARTSRRTSPIYGANDWCYSYGRSTTQSILRDTEFIVGLSPSGGVRPFSVIDGGWGNGTPAWPDMGKLAAEIKKRTARPGIWIRPLEAPSDAGRELLLSDMRFGEKKERARELAYDPTVPEAREKVKAKVREVTAWGYEMVKHDFSTYDLLGQWGFEMGPQPTLPGWSLHDRSLTNAEAIADLYSLIRETAGEQVVLDGCNTVGHLGQGVFDLNRTGDDTSGRHWERTRRMGVNTAAFRLPQHGTFFTMDADLVGITEAIPWELNRQWLDLLARSGTATMVSPGPPARGREQQAALRAAFQIAAAGGLGAKPDDWMKNSAPEHWSSNAKRGLRQDQRYDWSGEEGVSPFLAG